MTPLDNALYGRLNRRIHMDDIQALLRNYTADELLPVLVSLLKTDNKRVADNAAWIMTHFSDSVLVQNRIALLSLKSLCMQTADTTLRRLLMTLFERIYTPQDPLDIAFLNHCLDGMSNPSVPVGTRALYMKLAWQQCQLHTDLQAEMLALLHFMDRETDLSPAVACVRNHILKSASRSEING